MNKKELEKLVQQKLHPDVKYVGQIIHTHLEKIAKLFKDPKITIVVRQPGNDEGDLVLTDDNFDEVIKAIERTKKRDKDA